MVKVKNILFKPSLRSCFLWKLWHARAIQCQTTWRAVILLFSCFEMSWFSRYLQILLETPFSKTREVFAAIRTKLSVLFSAFLLQRKIWLLYFSLGKFWMHAAACIMYSTCHYCKTDGVTMTADRLGKGVSVCGLIYAYLFPPYRLSPPAADQWRRADSAWSGLRTNLEGGAPPKRAAWRLSPEGQDIFWGVKRAPPGSRIPPACTPYSLLPAGKGSLQPGAAQQQTQQPGLQAGPWPERTFTSESDSRLDGPSRTQAGAGYGDPAGAGQRELRGTGVSGSHRVQRREHTVPHGDCGKSEV